MSNFSYLTLSGTAGAGGLAFFFASFEQMKQTNAIAISKP